MKYNSIGAQEDVMRGNCYKDANNASALAPGFLEGRAIDEGRSVSCPYFHCLQAWTIIFSSLFYPPFMASSNDSDTLPVSESCASCCLNTFRILEERPVGQKVTSKPPPEGMMNVDVWSSKALLQVSRGSFERAKLCTRTVAISIRTD